MSYALNDGQFLVLCLGKNLLELKISEKCSKDDQLSSQISSREEPGGKADPC